jgi:hypothetical protein
MHFSERASRARVTGMERVALSIDGETLIAIREIAGPRGLSTFVGTAARERLARLRLPGLLDELDAKQAPTAKVKKAVARSTRREPFGVALDEASAIGACRARRV